jgi:MYXO-CTERM domain-containing protein
MRSTSRHVTFGLLAGLAGIGLSTPALAQTATGSSSDAPVVLNTSLTLGYQAPNGEMPTKRRDGAGVMDTTVAFDRTTGEIFSFFTRSVPWGNGTGLNTGMQAGLVTTQLTSTGLTTPVETDLPNQGNNAQRVFMRPNALLGNDFIAVVFADEDNGRNNNNPQSVIWVYDRKTLKQMNITNAGTIGQKETDPVNLITLSGDNDDQQQCPHSFCSLPDEADGSQSFIMGQQYNNQQARVMKVNLKTDGNGGVQVTVPYIKTIVQNARHNRVQLACPPATGAVSGNYIVATSVEADQQPANIGIRAVLVDVRDGSVAASTRFVDAQPNKNLYTVQPSVQYLNDGMVAIEYQMSASVRNGPGNGNGHSGGVDLSYLATLSVPSPGGQFKVLQTTPRVAPYNRHAEAFGLQYGTDGSSSMAVGVVGGSSTGLAQGLVQIVPINSDGTFDTVPDPLKLYEVSKYSDVAGLPAMTKRDPDQARGFIHAYNGLPNPGYQNPNGFMPEVKTFSIAAVAGYNNPSTDNRESLTFALVPSTWTPTVQTTPGSATPNVPPGPSPTAPVGTPVTNPTGPSAGSGAAPSSGSSTSGTGASSGSTGTSSGSNGASGSTGSSGKPYNPPTYAASSSGCGCTTAGSDKSSGFAGFTLAGLGIALLGLRRRSSKKES